MNANTLPQLEKRLQSGLGPTQDQRVDVMGAFIGVDRFKVHHVADHLKIPRDTVAAVHIAGMACNIKGFAAIVTLDQLDHFWCCIGVVHQPAHLKGGVQA